MADAKSQIERLRWLRTRPAPDQRIGSIIRATADHAERAHRKLGQLIELWEALLPKEIASRTTISAIRGGVAHVTVDSASTAYELDRLLRSGLLRELVSRYPGTLTRVKIKQGSGALTDPRADRRP